MGDLLGNAAGVLARTLENVQGQQAVYVRGNNRVSITVVPGKTSEDLYQVDEDFHGTKPQDWIVTDPGKLVTRFGQSFEPARGDAIDIPSTSIVGVPDRRVDRYRVLPLTGGQAFSPVDQTGRMLRIHTEKEG